MDFSIAQILGFILIILLILSGREYFSNGHKFTPKVKAQLRVSVIFCIVILFNLLMTKR